VSDTAGTKVTVVGQGKTLATFYLGKTSSDYSHTYVRADGSNAIKTAKGSLKATFVRTSTDWRNKVITSVAADSIQSILVAQQGSEPFTLLKDTASWILSPATVTIDQTKTTAFVTALSAVNASDFVADPDALALDLASPAVRITLQTVADSSILDLYVKDGAYYAKTNASSQIFVIAQYSFDALNKKPADLI